MYRLPETTLAILQRFPWDLTSRLRLSHHQSPSLHAGQSRSSTRRGHMRTLNLSLYRRQVPSNWKATVFSQLSFKQLEKGVTIFLSSAHIYPTYLLETVSHLSDFLACAVDVVN